MTENEQIKSRLVEIAQKELNNCGRFDTFGGIVYYPVSVQFFEEIGEQLNQEGYRKASEVAKVIIKSLIDFVDREERLHSPRHNCSWCVNSDAITDFIYEIKKKYTEGEK